MTLGCRDNSVRRRTRSSPLTFLSLFMLKHESRNVFEVLLMLHENREVLLGFTLHLGYCLPDCFRCSSIFQSCFIFGVEEKSSKRSNFHLEAFYMTEVLNVILDVLLVLADHKQCLFYVI